MLDCVWLTIKADCCSISGRHFLVEELYIRVLPTHQGSTGAYTNCHALPQKQTTVIYHYFPSFLIFTLIKKQENQGRWVLSDRDVETNGQYSFVCAVPDTAPTPSRACASREQSSPADPTVFSQIKHRCHVQAL